MKRIFLLPIVLFFLFFKAYGTDSWVLKNFPDSVTIQGLGINSVNEIFVIALYYTDEPWPVGVAYRSSDDGNNWMQIITPFDRFLEIFDILIDDNDHIYLGTMYGGVYKSVDNGITWEEKSEGLSNTVPVYLSKSSEGVFYAGQYWGGGIDYSTNGGNEWNPTNFPSNSGIKGMGVCKDDYIYANGGIYSADGGVSWETNNIGITGNALLNQVCYAFNESNEVFLGSINGIYFLSSIDSSWERLLLTSGYILDIIVTSQNTIYASANGVVFFSINKGQDWDNISDQFISTIPQEFCFDKDGYLWAASGTEIYKSQHIVTGLHEYTDHQKNVSVFPNPCSDQLSIDLENNMQDGESIRINLFSMEGKLQKSITENVFNNQVVINLKSLPAGPYLMKIDQRGYIIKNGIIIKE